MNLRSTITSAFVALAIASSANALTLTLSNAVFVNTTPTNSNPTDAEIAAALGVSVASIGPLKYKDNTGSEEGPFASSYNTQYFDSGGPTQYVTISYVSGPIATGVVYVLAKDGTEGSYAWNITGWNGTEQIIIGPKIWTQNSFSHVQVGGTGTTTVPDGGFTVLLLGAVFAGLGFLRRRFAS